LILDEDQMASDQARRKSKEDLGSNTLGLDVAAIYTAPTHAFVRAQPFFPDLSRCEPRLSLDRPLKMPLPYLENKHTKKGIPFPPNFDFTPST
jgi:hypothetical protein